MDILKMLTDLRAERQAIEEALVVVERLAAGTRGKRRGRPPKWMSAVMEVVTLAAPRKKRSISAAARKRIAAPQKKRWAVKKALAKAPAS